MPEIRETRSRTLTVEDGGLVVVIRSLRKHWTIVAACLVLAIGISLLYTRSITKSYQAATLIEIDPHVAQPLGEKGSSLELGMGFFFDSREYYETQYRIITSERVLNAVATNLALAADYEFMGLTSRPATPGSVEVAAAILRGRVSVDPLKGSRLANIRVEDTDPKRARKIADAVANEYVEQNLQNAIGASAASVVWLRDQLDHIKNDLESDENALHAFKEKNDLPSTSLNEASNMLRLEMQEYNNALVHTRTKKQELSARHAELSAVSPDNPDVLPASELLASAFLQSLRTSYRDAVQARLALTAEGKGENHPALRVAMQREEQARKALLAEVRNIQGAVERDLAVIRREEAGQAALFENARKRAVELNMKEIEYHRLDRSREQNEKVYAFLLERLKEADLARMMRVNNVRIVEGAAEPHSPIRPRASLNVTAGVLIGLIVGIALAWMREQLDSSIKTPDDLEEKLGVTCVGILPEQSEGDEKVDRKHRRPRQRKVPAGRPPELLVHDRPTSGIAEAARSIRTNLMFMNPDQPFRRLLVSSAAPSEGKTTVACNIAIALAQSGQRVCIIDCDLRRPRLHRIFDRRGDAGVTNVLIGDATIEEVARPTEVDNLYSIPAGPIPPNAADMLHSDRFKKFLNDLSERFDRIIIDSPPLVAVTDSAIISTLVDGTVFVVRAFRTSKHLSRQGLRTLRDVDARIIGGVLNAIDLNRRGYEYYYYQQYYQYKRDGYGPRPDDDADKPSAAAPN